MIQLAQRPTRGARVTDLEFRVGSRGGRAPITQTMDGRFYVGIGFCSHLPDTLDTAVVSNVVLENAAGKIR